MPTARQPVYDCRYHTGDVAPKQWFCLTTLLGRQSQINTIDIAKSASPPI